MTERIIAGRYRLVELLGTGAMGQVWSADDALLKRRVAVKMLRRDAIEQASHKLRERMQREARVGARLAHPGLVTVYDLQIEGDDPHVVMEYVRGESLAQRLRREHRLSVAEAAQILAPVAAGLARVHSVGVVHRDIKPGNVLIPAAGPDTTGLAKLGDFGIARGPDDTLLTDGDNLLGTLAFMAPEVVRGNPATRASDIWSLGATLFAAVEGHAPFEDPRAPHRPTMLLRIISEDAPAPALAGALTDTLKAMLNPDPKHRPTADDVAQQLQRIDAAQAWTPRTSRHRRRRLSAVVAAAAATTAAIVLAVQTQGPAKARHRAASTPVHTIQSEIAAKPLRSSPAPEQTTASIQRSLPLVPDPHAVTQTLKNIPDAMNYAAVADGILFGATYGNQPVIPIQKYNTVGRLTDIGSIPSPLRFGYPVDMVASPDGRLYVAIQPGGERSLTNDGYIQVLNTTTSATINEIEVADGSGQLALSADGSRLLVGGKFGVSVIDTHAGKVIATFASGADPASVAITPDGKLAYVQSMKNHDLEMFDLVHGVEITQFDRFAAWPSHVTPYHNVAVSPDASRVFEFVSGFGRARDVIKVFDATRGILLATIQLSSMFEGTMAIAPSGRYLYVLRTGNSWAEQQNGTVDMQNPAPGAVIVIDTRTYQQHDITVTAAPTGICVSPDGKQVYVFALGPLDAQEQAYSTLQEIS